MSEISEHSHNRIQKLHFLFYAILRKQEAKKTIEELEEIINLTRAADVISVVDMLVQEAIPIEELKTGLNKWLNMLSGPLKENENPPEDESVFLNACQHHNDDLDILLKNIRPYIQEINDNPGDAESINDIRNALMKLNHFPEYYVIKENVLFPFLEKQWPEYRCMQVMWSYHDDIRDHLKVLLEMMEGDRVDLPLFNRLIGKLYFGMYTIRFREEYILFPHMLETIDAEAIDKALLRDAVELGFPYYEPQVGSESTDPGFDTGNLSLNLSTGDLSLQQLELLFKHLPVDVTFVDEHDEVVFYSDPPHRIFPRSRNIIGRDVRNCHPPESVDVVERIIESFKNSEHDHADFWIPKGDRFILIRYFAVRDESGSYKGVLEVSQEVSEIKALKGERRLLEW